MATAPTFVGESDSGDSATGTATSPSVAILAGDILAGLAGNEGNNAETFGNSGAALTWTTRQDVSAASFARVVAATAIGDSGRSLTFNATTPSGHSLLNVLRFRASDGVGASAKANTTGAPSLALTTLQDNAAIVVLVTDFNAVDGATRTWRTVNGIAPSVGNGFEQTYFRNAAAYTVYVGYYPDAGVAGSKTVGLSAPSGQQYSIVALEVKSLAAAVAPAFPPRIITPRGTFF